MKTVLLAGGFGTRIRDVSADVPKPMIPIGHYPILLHIMRIYSAANFREFIIALGYKGEVIKQFFLNYQSNTHDLTIRLGTNPQVTFHRNDEKPIDDWEITLVDTGLHSMTGARVRMIKQYLHQDDTFMLTYGDGVSNVDLKELVAFHHRHGKIMTVTGVYPPGRFGELTVKDGSTQVIGFNEKPQTSGGLISGGFFVCNRRIFDYLDDRDDLVLEQGPMQRLTLESQLEVFRHEGFWHPMDTHRDFSLLNELWDRGDAPWKTW